MEKVKNSKESELPLFTNQEIRKKQTDYAILLITLNEGDKLKKQIDELQEYQSLVDIIIVDGGSDDNSTELTYLESKNVRTLITCHERGIGSALRVGLSYALEHNYTGILTIDCNGKDGVESIPQIIEKLENGYDFVQASRFMKGGVHKNTPFFRMMGIFIVIIPALFLGSGFWFTDPTNGFKGFSRRFLLDPKTKPFRQVFKMFNMQFYLNYRAPKLGFSTIEIPAKRVYPDDGTVPTKIHGLATHLQIMYEIFKTCLGGYNPKL